LRELAIRPSHFYGEAFLQPDLKDVARFSMFSGLLLAAGLSLLETAVGRSWTVAAVSLILLLTLPFLFLLASYVWAYFMKTTASLLGETVPFDTARVVAGYSMAGLLPLMLGRFGSWLALATILLQVLGLERGLGCSRFKATVLTLFPTAIAALFSLFYTFMFEVF